MNVTYVMLKVDLFFKKVVTCVTFVTYVTHVSCVMHVSHETGSRSSKEPIFLWFFMIAGIADPKIENIVI